MILGGVIAEIAQGIQCWQKTGRAFAGIVAGRLSRITGNLNLEIVLQTDTHSIFKGHIIFSHYDTGHQKSD